MNREDIIRMAREAGFHVMTDPLFGDAWLAQHHEDNFYKFAALVAAAEREAMMQLFTDPENQPTQHGTVTVEYMQREALREASPVQEPTVWVRPNGVNNSGVAHYGPTCPPGWVGAATAYFKAPAQTAPTVQEPVAWVPIITWRWNNEQGYWEGRTIPLYTTPTAGEKK